MIEHLRLAGRAGRKPGLVDSLLISSPAGITRVLLSAALIVSFACGPGCSTSPDSGKDPPPGQTDPPDSDGDDGDGGTLPDLKPSESMEASAGQEVELDAGDVGDSADGLSYLWEQTLGPDVALDDPRSPNPRFFAPEADEDSEIVFRLTITDESGDTVSSIVTVRVRPNRSPIAAAGFDKTTSGGAMIVLSGCASVDPDPADELTYQWLQVSGPGVALQDETSADASFLAPVVLETQDLLFELTVTDGRERSDSDAVLVTVDPTSLADEVLISSVWTDAVGGNVQVDLNWTLPSGTLMPIDRAGWADNGVESVSLPSATIPDGIHWLTFALLGSGRTARVTYDVEFLGYRFATDEVLRGELFRAIGLDVVDGAAHVVYNGWLGPEEQGAGLPSTEHIAEAQSGWRSADGVNVHVDLDMFVPDGTKLPVFRTGWNDSGFEQVHIPAGLELDDGTYQSDFFLAGDGRTSDVTYAVDFPCYQFRFSDQLQAEVFRMLGIAVTDGVAAVVFNGWLESGDPGAGGVTGTQALEVVSSWRDASGGDVHIDVDVTLPDGTLLPVWGNGWSSQGFEHVFLPADVELQSGTYELSFALAGTGQTADVTYDVQLLDYRFSVAELLLAPQSHSITIQVNDGDARETGNTWAE